MTRFSWIVTVICESEEEAMRVVSGLLNQDTGFEYGLDIDPITPVPDTPEEENG